MITSVISIEYVDILKKMEGEKLPVNIQTCKDLLQRTRLICQRETKLNDLMRSTGENLSDSIQWRSFYMSNTKIFLVAEKERKQ
jgi:hypothetical protein